MKQNVQRINENQLKAIVSECVKKVLNELDSNDNSTLNNQAKEIFNSLSLNDYDDIDIFEKVDDYTWEGNVHYSTQDGWSFNAEGYGSYNGGIQLDDIGDVVSYESPNGIKGEFYL